MKIGLDEDISRTGVNRVIPITYSWVSSPYAPPDNEANLTVTVMRITDDPPIMKPATLSTAVGPQPGINIQTGCSDVDGPDNCVVYVDSGPRFGTLHQVLAYGAAPLIIIIMIIIIIMMIIIIIIIIDHAYYVPPFHPPAPRKKSWMLPVSLRSTCTYQGTKPAPSKWTK
jgi:hypothetical protein